MNYKDAFEYANKKFSNKIIVVLHAYKCISGEWI